MRLTASTSVVVFPVPALATTVVWPVPWATSWKIACW
jgi:hypothetical protein